MFCGFAGVRCEAAAGVGLLLRRCGRRCERSTALAPQGYPEVGYYCPLHEYQKPKPGQPASEEYAAHLRKCASYNLFETSGMAAMGGAGGRK